MTRFAVLGPGGVGGILAARLALAGHDVVVVASASTAAAITSRGLQLTAPDGSWEVAVEARSYLTAPVDTLVVAVKATDLLPALSRVPAELVRAATVVPLLNGVDHVPLLRAALPGAAVVGTSIAVEATRHRPGVVEQLSQFCDLTVADGTAEGAAFAETARAAGLSVTTHPDEATVLWRKLSFLAPLALLTTAEQAPIGIARRVRHAWVRPLVEEACAAAATCGADIDPDAIEERLRGIPDPMQSSMQKDRAADNELELDAIAGPVIRAVGRDGAPTTVEAVRTILGG